MFQCLVLTPWFAPHQIVPWQKAISQEYAGEIDVLERYDEEARSPSVTIRFPAVARLMKRLSNQRKDVKFSRPNIYARDNYTCQYCGKKRDPKHLNFDHVHPRSKGGLTNWTNITTACLSCNLRKGSKTLEEAGMSLRSLPRRPKTLPMSATSLVLPASVPALWVPYLADRLAGIGS